MQAVLREQDFGHSAILVDPTDRTRGSLERPEGGWISATPGVRGFGLAHIPQEELILGFPELAEGAADCPPLCSHLEEGCALDAWVAAGHASPLRLESFRRLLTSRDETADQ